MTSTQTGNPMLAGRAAAGMWVFGCAILALALWRMREANWGEWAWMGSFLAMFAIRSPHAIQNRANRVKAESPGVLDRMMLLAMFGTMMVTPLIDLSTSLLRFADYRLPTWAMWIGMAMQVPFLWLFWRSHADLGRNWSPGLEVREGHQLVTSGVYRRIRHPMYAAIWLSVLAQPLLIQNWIGGALAVPTFLTMYLYRVRHEESLMRSTFGSAYDAYAAATGRVVPAGVFRR